MSNRLAFSIAVIILLVGAFLRLRDLNGLPPGLNDSEVTQARIAETVRMGRTEVFFAVDGDGREGAYPALLTAFTTLGGGGAFTMRLMSVFAGLLALAALYALGKRLYGAPTGLVAMALMAVSMLPIVLSRAVIPEAFAPVLTVLALLLLARAYPIFGRLPRQEPSVTTFAMLGGLLGLGFYLTPAAFPIALIAVLFIAYLVLTRQPMSRRTLSYTWFALVVLIVIATPYLIASLQNPELSGASRVLDSTVTQPLNDIINGIGGIFFAGDASAAWNLPERPLLDLVSGLLLLVGIYITVRGWRQPRFMLVLLALILLTPYALLSSTSPNFLRFAPLVPVLMLVVGLGVTALYRQLHSREARLVVAVALAGLVIFNVQWTARDLYSAWPRLDDMQAAYDGRVGIVARYLDRTSAQLPTVICTSTLVPPQSPEALTDPQLLLLNMHRQDVPLRFADCRSGLVFPNAGERFQVVMLDEDARSVHPLVRQWLRQGDPADVAGLTAGTVTRLDIAQPLADTIGSFTTTAPVAFAPESPGGMEVTGPPLRLGGNLTLLGYMREWGAPSAPLDLVTVPTFWRVDGQVPLDLRLFTHIQSDPAAIPVAQTDTLSVLPDTLQPRDIFLQVTTIPLPVTLPDGSYSLSTGAYETNTGMRLPVYDGEEARGDRVFIGEIAVQG